MKKSYFILLLALSPLMVKCQYRFSFKIANIKSSAYFESNNQNFYLDNDPMTRMSMYSAYRINPENTIDWSEPLGTNSFLTDIGKGLALELGVERQINKHLSISTGFEVGSRYFSISKINYKNDTAFNDETTLAKRSIKNFSIPFNIAYDQNIFHRFSIKPNAGFAINIPESFKSQLLNEDYVALSYSPIYFTISIGTELKYTFVNGSGISLTALYSQGFNNIIKDYIGDNRVLKDSIFDISTGTYTRNDHNYINKVAVACNGSNLSLGIKYYFLPFGKSTLDKIKKTSLRSLDFDKRTVGEANEIFVDTNYVKLCLWDDQKIDGDSIALEFKDSIIGGNLKLNANKKCIWIKVEKNQPNYLIVHALNEGRVKPNTVSLVIYSRKKEIPISVKTDLIKSGNINIKFE